MNPKFSVGQMVAVIGSKIVRFRIVEVLTQTCVAGTQYHYTGRMFIKSQLYGRTDWEPTRDYSKYNEMELELIPEPSPKMKELLDQKKELLKQKDAFIKSQDFEKAVEVKDTIKRLEVEIDSLEMKEGEEK